MIKDVEFVPSLRTKIQKGIFFKWVYIWLEQLELHTSEFKINPTKGQDGPQYGLWIMPYLLTAGSSIFL